MKRNIAIAVGVLAVFTGVITSKVWWRSHSRHENTFYSERYSDASFARIKVDMPRATVIEILGNPFNAARTEIYPVAALHNKAAQDRYGKDNEISVEYAVFSAPKDSRRPHQRVAVYFGPEGTVLEASNSTAD